MRMGVNITFGTDVGAYEHGRARESLRVDME